MRELKQKGMELPEFSNFQRNKRRITRGRVIESVFVFENFKNQYLQILQLRNCLVEVFYTACIDRSIPENQVKNAQVKFVLDPFG